MRKTSLSCLDTLAMYPLRIFTAVGNRSQLLEKMNFDQQYAQRNETSHCEAVKRCTWGVSEIVDGFQSMAITVSISKHSQKELCNLLLYVFEKT